MNNGLTLCMPFMCVSAQNTDVSPKCPLKEQSTLCDRNEFNIHDRNLFVFILTNVIVTISNDKQVWVTLVIADLNGREMNPFMGSSSSRNNCDICQ